MFGQRTFSLAYLSTSSSASMVQRDNRKFVWEAYELETRDFEWNQSSSC